MLNNKFKQVFFWNIEYFILNNEIYYEEQYNQIILKLHPIYMKLIKLEITKKKIISQIEKTNCFKLKKTL